MILTGALLMAVVAMAGGSSLPENFVTCADDEHLSNCLIAAVPDALLKMKKGIPSLSLPPLEPLAVSGFSVTAGAGPVRLAQHYKGVKLHGLTSSKLTTYKADLKNFHLQTSSITPKMQFIGDYVMKGRILVLPIQGKGVANITMLNLTVHHDLQGRPVVREGRVYMHIQHYRVRFQPQRVLLHFSNLFNGDKRLGDQMNVFLNENSELVFNELKESYENSLSSVFRSVSNKIFDAVPMDKIFPKKKEV